MDRKERDGGRPSRRQSLGAVLGMRNARRRPGAHDPSATAHRAGVPSTCPSSILRQIAMLARMARNRAVPLSGGARTPTGTVLQPRAARPARLAALRQGNDLARWPGRNARWRVLEAAPNWFLSLPGRRSAWVRAPASVQPANGFLAHRQDAEQDAAGSPRSYYFRE